MRVGEQLPENKPDGDPGCGSSGFAVALFAACALGVVLRALHLDIPMRYDETVTYVSYASHGWEYVTSNYQNPNNHVFHSLLVAWVTGWLGGDPLSIRLPAFLAGCAVVPAVAWVALRAHGREAAVLAAALVATWPLLIEFSVNARGYSLVTLAIVLAAGVGLVLLARPRWVVWLAWIELGVVALYTIPAAAIPWLGLTLWLAWGLVRAAAPGRRLSVLRPLAISTAVIGVVALALYSGILRRHGAEALTANRFVAPSPPLDVLAATPGEVLAILESWSRGMPLALFALLLVCAAAGLRTAGRGHEWTRLLGSVIVGALVMMAVVRNWGEPRIWQWAVPLIAITVAAGIMEIGRRAVRPPRLGHAAGMALGWAVLGSAHLLLASPVRASLDTGASPRVPEVFDAMVDHYRLGDWLVGDFVSIEPLRYYLAAWAAENEPGPEPDMQRAWVLVDAADSVRSHAVRQLLARMGAPPLAELRPVMTAGDLSIYLLGRPEAMPDLIEDPDTRVGVVR